MNSEQIHSQILYNLRELQKRNRFIVSAHDSLFSLSEAHIVIELCRNPEQSAQDLAKIVGLEKSTIVRSIDSLIENGLLLAKINPSDKRRRKLFLTQKGTQALKQLDENANRNVSIFSKSLDLEQIAQLSNYLKIFSDNLGAAMGELRAGESPLRLEVRRLTRALGLIGANFMSSGLSSTQWQILCEIKFASTTLGPSELSSNLRISRAAMSSALKRLRALGLISTSSHGTDKRALTVKLSDKGIKTLQKIENTAQERFSKALKSLSMPKLQTFSRLLALYCSENQLSGPLQAEITIKRIMGEEARQVARAFLILELVRKNAFTFAPEILIGKDSICYGLYEANTLRILLEFQLENGDWTLENFAASANYEDDSLAYKFISQCLERFFELMPNIAKVRVLPGSKFAKVLNLLNVKRATSAENLFISKSDLQQILSADHSTQATILDSLN